MVAKGTYVIPKPSKISYQDASTVGSLEALKDLAL
jgi:hypothetical protein